MGAGPISGAAARQAAETELLKAKYHQGGPGPVQRLYDWISRRIDSIGSFSVGGTTTLLVVLLLGGLLIFAIARAGRPERMIRAAGPGDLAPAENVDHAARARAFHSDGRFAEALREWLRDTSRTVERRGVLDPQPGRTAAELARGAGAAMPSAADALTVATQAFDEIWFGERAATAADAEFGRIAATSVRTATIAHQSDPFLGYAVPR